MARNQTAGPLIKGPDGLNQIIPFMSPVIPTSPVSSEARPTRESSGPDGGLHPLQAKAVEFVRSNLQERPFVTLGVAVAVGLLIGRLVKR